MRLSRKLLGLEPDIEEINRVPWSNIHIALHAYRVIERSGRRAIEAQTNNKEEAKEICSILERCGYECNLEHERLERSPKVVISV